MKQNKLSFSNLLILLSIFFTILKLYYPNVKVFWMNDVFLFEEKYYLVLVQLFSSQFLHGDFFHLLFNAIFIFYFGNILESFIGYKKMLLFFISNSIFVGISLMLFASGNTIGISWFALAVLTYYTLMLKEQNNPEYTGWVTAIVINILIGLSPGISFVWHFSGMIFWALFYIFSLRKKHWHYN